VIKSYLEGSFRLTGALFRLTGVVFRLIGAVFRLTGVLFRLEYCHVDRSLGSH